jgi:dephospho-CoA kinase
MKVVGLCGQSGSGKGLICSLFSELNVISIDTDEVYHNIISVNSECTEELVSAFGKSILLDCGINRKELAAIVFSSKEKINLLNEITHRHILGKVRSEIERIKADKQFDGIIVDAPLLFESGFDKECDATIAVIADLESKISRITKRDSITKEHAMKRLSSQLSDEELKKRCDYIIVNNAHSPDELREKISELKKIIFD